MRLAREAGDDWSLGYALELIAGSWAMQGVLTQARRCLAESYEVARRLGNPHFLAWHWFTTALVAIRDGQMPAAVVATSQARVRAAEIDDPICLAWTALCCAEVDGWHGRAEEAAEAIARLARRSELSIPAAAMVLRVARGKCALALGHLDTAESEYLEGRRIAQREGPTIVDGECLIDLSEIFLLRGDPGAGSCPGRGRRHLRDAAGQHVDPMVGQGPARPRPPRRRRSGSRDSPLPAGAGRPA